MTNLTLSEQDALDFAQQNPQPEAPEVVTPSRPEVFAFGSAHLWMDVIQTSAGYSKPDRVTARLYVIERKEGHDARIQADLDAETLVALIDELSRAQSHLEELQEAIEAATQYETAYRTWQARRDEYVREKRIERERAQAAAEKSKK